MDLLRRRAAGLLHKFTATVIHDFDWNEVKVVGQKYRRKARLVLVVLVLCAFLVAAVMLTFRQPSIRTDLKTGIDVTAKLSASITHGPTSSSNDSDLPFICPCSVPENSWCSYTTFYLLYPQQIMNVHGIVIIEQLPIDTKTNYAGVANEFCGDKSGDTCHSVMDYTLCADDVAHTNMFTANLLSFATLYDDVAKEIEDTIIAATSRTLAPNGTNVDNRTLTVAALMTKMASQFRINTSSSTLDFWNASKNVLEDAVSNYKDVEDLPQGLGLRMSVNWTRYMELCKPSFCIVISHTTTRYRLLQALSQAGGMYAAIILVARIVVWPIFLWLYSLCSIKCQTNDDSISPRHVQFKQTT